MKYVAGGVIAISALLIWGSFTQGHEFGDDFAGYIMQARSIIDGDTNGYLLRNTDLIAHTHPPHGPNAYPWGYPLLLSPVHAIFGFDLLAYKHVAGVSFVLFLVVIWWGFRHHAPGYRLLLLGIFAFNYGMIRFTDNIVSDIPFLLFSTLSVACIGRIINDDRPMTTPNLDGALLGLIIGASFMIRSNGILLLVPLAVALVHRRSRYGDMLLAGASFAGIMLIQSIILPDGSRSHFELLQVPSYELLIDQMLHYLLLPVQFFSDIPYREWIYAVSIPFALAGAVLHLRTRPHEVAYVAAVILLHVLWPHRQGVRFIYPILPFYVSFLLTGMTQFSKKVSSPRNVHIRLALVAVPMTVLVLLSADDSIRHAWMNLQRDRERVEGAFTPDAQGMYAFIRGHVPEDMTVRYFKPRTMMMMTDRRAITVRGNGKPLPGEYVCLTLPVTGADLKVLSPGEDQSGTPMRVFENNSFVVYKAQ